MEKVVRRVFDRKFFWGESGANLLYAVQDANDHVTALYNNVNSAPHLVERYEYNPYGQRTVYQYFNASLNYTTNIGWGCDNPTLVSRRFVDAANITQSYGLCEFGHQGLYHDEEVGLIYNRARTLHPGLGRFMQEDLLGYVDGYNIYEYISSCILCRVDPMGTKGTEAECKDVAKKIVNLMKKIAQRKYELERDWSNLPEDEVGDDIKPGLSRNGHRRRIKKDEEDLEKRRKFIDDECLPKDPCPNNAPVVAPDMKPQNEKQPDGPFEPIPVPWWLRAPGLLLDFPLIIIPGFWFDDMRPYDPMHPTRVMA